MLHRKMVVTAHCVLGSLKNGLSKMDTVAHAYNASMREGNKQAWTM